MMRIDSVNTHQKGFTLIELITILLIISVVVVATVRWPSRTINLDVQVQKLINDIQYVQFLAMSRDELYRIQFSQNSYTLTREDDDNTPINFPSVIESPGTTHRNIVQLDEGITLTTDLQLNGHLLFDGQGIPYDNSLTALTQPADITLTLDDTGQSKTITITPETGKIDI